MKRYTIGIGIGQNRHGKPIAPLIVESFKRVLILKGVQWFGGITIRDTVGGWRDDSTGRVHIEPGLSIEILAPDSAESELKARQFARDVGKAMNQAAIVFIREDVNAEFCTIEEG